MLKAIAQYVKDEVLPRWKDIFLSWESVISVAVIVFFGKLGSHLFFQYPKISDVTAGLIAYLSIALGFCVAGLTISLTFPQPDFTSHLATPLHHPDSKNHYSDLIFVFSWTAVAHWVALLGLFCLVLFADGSTPLFPRATSAARTWSLATLAGLCSYCLCQFLIVLITLSQVGNLYIKFLANNAKKVAPAETKHDP